MAELVLVAEQQGRVLHRSPFLASTCMAVRALWHVGSTEEHAELLPPFLEGTRVGTLICPQMTADGSAPSVVARSAAGGYVLAGSGIILDSSLLTDLVVLGRLSDEQGGLALFIVDVDEDGVRRQGGGTLDASRRIGEVVLEDVPARRIGVDAKFDGAFARAVADARTCLAADLVGGAQACLEATLEHARVRHQFGRPIGSYQAIKHQCADLATELELARSAVARAVQLADEDAGVWAAIAKAAASEAFARVARASIQIHGGIGFTWEHDAHLYYRRAMAARPLLGAPDALYEDLARKDFEHMVQQADISSARAV